MLIKGKISAGGEAVYRSIQSDKKGSKSSGAIPVEKAARKTRKTYQDDSNERYAGEVEDSCSE